MFSRRSFVFSLLAGPLMLLTACSSDGETSSTAVSAGTNAAGNTPTASASTEQVTLRLGYFPNITHAPALVGVQLGLFAKALGPNVRLQTATFNAGPAATEALFADAIDATYIGPNPAINAYVKSKGDALRIVAGSTSGGAFLVVKPEIKTAADLQGKKIASPQLGGTQDVALRSWLKQQGYATDTSGGGDVSVVPQDNGATLDAFKAGDIDGGWLPEPWATRLIQEGGGMVLVDERTLWPEGQFATTHVIVAKGFLEKHPDVVKGLIQGELDSLDYIKANEADAQKAANAQIDAITQKPLQDAVIAASWKNLEFTYDPIASSLKTSADAATAVGLLDKVDLDGIYSLDILKRLLQDKGLAEVKGF
jgi:NitT/TauT family transport system substrate-binding protein